MVKLLNPIKLLKCKSSLLDLIPPKRAPFSIHRYYSAACSLYFYTIVRTERHFSSEPIEKKFSNKELENQSEKNTGLSSIRHEHLSTGARKTDKALSEKLASKKIENVALLKNDWKSSPLYRPVSLLGLGDVKTAKYWRSKMRYKNRLEVKDLSQSKIEDDDLPVFLRLRHKQNPKDVEEQFPEVCNFLRAATEESVKEESEPHFPFQLNDTISVASESVPTTNSNQRHGVTTPSTSLNSVPESLHKATLGLIKYLEDHDVDKIPDFKGAAPLTHELKDEIWRLNYGSPDPSIQSSKLPCNGCGALLHCQDTNIPGYIPSERFKLLRKNSGSVLCNRCVLLQEHNVALQVNISNNDYPRILSKLKSKASLILLLVDLTDFPCSIWPGIVDIVGKNCPMIVVGTKVDLLPRDQQGYLKRVFDALSQSLLDYGVDRGKNILDVHLLSAKTGWGVESLITKIHKYWADKGDVYLIGCTNVGKSTLYNVLLESDLCYIKALDLVHRATTSVWPGTTLNLLKFPVQRPIGYRQIYRKHRLKNMLKEEIVEKKLQESLYKATKDPKYATLVGRIEVTSCDERAPLEESLVPRKNFSIMNDTRFNKGHFCYDTPGCIYQDQILDLLTVEELMMTLPKEIITPRTFLLKSFQTLFLAGLARIDMLEIQDFTTVLVTVFASPHLPVHVISTDEANLFYSQNLGTSLLAVPFGGPKRLADFPRLRPREFTCIGTYPLEACVDVVLSSAGWVSMTCRQDRSCSFKAYTPDGRGCYLRHPPLLPFAVRLRGKKIEGTPAFENTRCSIVIED